MRRQLLVLFSATAAVCSTTSSVNAAPANIDAGFIQDGDTTYCQGVDGATENPLEFLNLEAHNAGRCPIDVLISVTASTVGLLSPMEVQWAASVHSEPIPDSIFPHAVDPATKKPGDVIASLLRACKVGTNCDPSGVVIPQVLDAADAETGPFDAQGRKALRPFRFQFPNPGEHVIVGVVTLPGDPVLNVSATQYVAFQKVIVVEGTGPATVKPPSTTGNSTDERGAEAKTENLNFGDSIIKNKNETSSTTPTTTLPTPSGTRATNGGVDAEFTGSGKNGSSSGEGLNLTMILTVAVVVLLIIVAIILFVVVRKKSKALKRMDRAKPRNPNNQAGVFRLSSTADMMASPSLGSTQKYMATNASSSTTYTANSHTGLAPPRYTTTSQSSSIDSGPFSRRQPSSNGIPSYENASLVASGKEFRAPSPRLNRYQSGGNRNSNVSDASSFFSDLHDSCADLPVMRPSAATSYAYDDYSRTSSRLFSEASLRDVSEYNKSYKERESEFDSRRSTELGALSEYGSSINGYAV